MLKLDAMLPRNRTVVIDSGHSMGWPIIYLSAPDAAGFVFSNDFMAVGLGLEQPSALRSPAPIV